MGTNELAEDLARSWLAYDHCRVLIVSRILTLGGWFVDDLAATNPYGRGHKFAPRLDDLKVEVSPNNGSCHWYVYFRAGRDDVKIRAGQAYVSNECAAKTLATRIADTGLSTEVYELRRYKQWVK